MIKIYRKGSELVASMGTTKEIYLATLVEWFPNLFRLPSLCQTILGSFQHYENCNRFVFIRLLI
jgi:hypothetical protein